MAMTHSDPEVNAMIQTLEFQRDNAVVLASQRAREVADAVAQIQVLAKENADLKLALEAAAQFQGGNVIELNPGGNAA